MRPQSKQFQILIITVLVALIPFCAYYLLYVSAQKKYFTTRNFRLLAGISDQISLKIENLSKALEFASTSVEINKDTDRELLKHIPNMQLTRTSRVAGESEADILSEKANTKEIFKSYKDKLVSEVQLHIKQEGKTFWLYFDYTGSIDGKPDIKTQAKSDLNELIKPFVNQKAFDEILVVQQQDGRVVFQGTPSILKITSLKTLTDKDGKEIQLDSINPPTSTLNIPLADAYYHIYLQSIQIPILIPPKDDKPDDQKVAKWVVCGMIRSDRFNSECKAISSNYLIKVIFLLLIIALSWPIFKLLLMGQRDRLGISDVCFLVFSLVMVSAFLTFALMDAYSYYNARDKLDSQLKSFSEKVGKNFQEETDRIRNELKKLNDRRKSAVGESRNREKIPQQKTNLFKEDLVKYSDPYPYFTMAIWIDDTGQQRIKWTVKDRITPFINVSTREYFKKPHEDWLFEKEGDKSRVWLEPVYSWNTGENTSLVSSPTSITGTTTQWVASIDTRLLTFYQTVLPPGFGYCVIDETGKVLFHSDETKNLRENFFEECDNNYALCSSVFGHIAKHFNAQYEGKDHRIYGSPLNYGDFQGYLMVFRNKELHRTANLEMLTVSSIFLMLLFFIPLIIFCLYYLGRFTWWMISRRMPASYIFHGRIYWLWPNKLWGKKYGQIIFFNLFLCVVLYCGILYFQGWNLILCTVPLYLLGVFLIYPGLKKDLKFLKVNMFSGIFKHQYRTGYLVVIVSSVILLVVLPSCAFFKFAYNEEMKLFVKHGQIKLASSLEARGERVKSQYLKIKFGSEDEKKKFLVKRLDFRNWDVYDSFFFDTDTGVKHDVKCTPSVGNSFLNQFLSTLRPHYKQVCTEINGLMNNASDDKVWHWEKDGSGKLVFHKNGYKNVGKKEGVLHISSLVPTLEVPLTRFWWIWILLVFLLLVLFFMVRFVLQRVFLFDVKLPSPLYVEGLKEGFSYLILGTSYAKKEFPPNHHPIDLREEAKTEKWYTIFMSEEYLHNREVVVIDNFDYQWNNPQHNNEKLQLLERLFMDNKTVIIASHVHPDNFNLELSAENSTEAQSKESTGEHGNVLSFPLMERWKGIFKSLPVVYSQEQGDPEAFQREMGVDGKGVNYEKEILCRECKPKEYLQNMGREMVKNYIPEKYALGQIIQIISDRAQRYYHALWNTFSQSEKFTLYYVVKDGFISPENPDIPRLLMRNIIIRNPELRVMNVTFHKFILAESTSIDVVAWKKEARSNWNTTKGPFLTLLIGIALFVFITQREVFNSTIAIISAFTAALPAVFKLFGLFQKGKPD